MRLVPACYTSGRGISLNKALFQLRPLHYNGRQSGTRQVDQMVSTESVLFASALVDAHLQAHAGVLHAAADAPPVLVLVLRLQPLTQRLQALLLEGAAVFDAGLLQLLELLLLAAVWLSRGRRLCPLGADHS